MPLNTNDPLSQRHMTLTNESNGRQQRALGTQHAHAHAEQQQQRMSLGTHDAANGNIHGVHRSAGQGLLNSPHPPRNATCEKNNKKLWEQLPPTTTRPENASGSMLERSQFQSAVVAARGW